MLPELHAFKVLFYTMFYAESVGVVTFGHVTKMAVTPFDPLYYQMIILACLTGDSALGFNIPQWVMLLMLCERMSMFTDVVVCKSGKLQSHADAPALVFSLFRIVVWYLSPVSYTHLTLPTNREV